MPVVVAVLSGEPPCDRLDPASLKAFSQNRIGHQARDAAVSARKGVKPEQAVMRGGSREHAVDTAQSGIGLPEALQEPR